jgi:Periplasmic binding protein domain
VTTVATNNKAGAGTGAEFAASLINGKGKVAMLEGEPGGQTTADRKSGFHEGIAKFPEIKLVASINGHWTEPGGLEATEALIAGHKDLDLIFAASDMMGIGARQVLERAAQKAKAAGDNPQAERFKAVKIVGFDGVTEGFKAVKDGSFSGTVAQMPETMGTRGRHCYSANERRKNGRRLSKVHRFRCHPGYQRERGQGGEYARPEIVVGIFARNQIFLNGHYGAAEMSLVVGARYHQVLWRNSCA